MRDDALRARGSDDIKAVLERKVGPMRQVRADGLFCWLEVECLGACCNAPMVQINDDYYEDLTPRTSRSCWTTSKPAAR